MSITKRNGVNWDDWHFFAAAGLAAIGVTCLQLAKKLR